MTYLRRLVTLFCLSVVSAGVAQAAVIDGFSSATNDRFANDESFIAAEYDLSGVAITEGNHWVTMISPNVFLTSNHFKSAPGTAVSFYATNDPNGPSLSRTIGSTAERVGDSDIWIGVLDTPLTLDYTYYTFATQNTTNDNRPPGGGPNAPNAESFINSPYYLAEAFMFGKSPTTWPRSQNMAVGKNVIDRFLGTITAAGTTDIAFGADYDSPSASNYIQYETILEVGDSGGPMMVSENGSLVLVGTNWYTYNGTQPGTGFAYVGNYTNEINAFLAGNSLPAIPEPAHAAWLAALAAFVAVLRRQFRA